MPQFSFRFPFLLCRFGPRETVLRTQLLYGAWNLHQRTSTVAAHTL